MAFFIILAFTFAYCWFEPKGIAGNLIFLLPLVPLQIVMMLISNTLHFRFGKIVASVPSP